MSFEYLVIELDSAGEEISRHQDDSLADWDVAGVEDGPDVAKDIAAAIAAQWNPTGSATAWQVRVWLDGRQGEAWDPSTQRRRDIPVPGTWDAGTTPWARRQPDRTPMQCYFCGQDAAILSYNDLDDAGRLELYCDNPNCDVRTVAVIVLKDGTNDTAARADVRALERIDRGPAARGRGGGSLRTLGSSQVDPGDVIARRRAPEPDDHR